MNQRPNPRTGPGLSARRKARAIAAPPGGPERAAGHPGTAATLRALNQRALTHLGVAILCLLGALCATALVSADGDADRYDTIGVVVCVVLLTGAIAAAVAFGLALVRANRIAAVLRTNPWTRRRANLEPGQAVVRGAGTEVLALRDRAGTGDAADGTGPRLLVTPVSGARADLFAGLDDEEVWFAGSADGFGVVAPRGAAFLVLVRTVSSADPETAAAAAELADRHTPAVTWSAVPAQVTLRRSLGSQAARRLTDTAIPVLLPEDQTGERIRLTDLTMVDGEVRALGLRVGTPGGEGPWTRVLVERPGSPGAAPAPGVRIPVVVDGRPETFAYHSNGRSAVAVGFVGRWQVKVFTRNRPIEGMRLVSGSALVDPAAGRPGTPDTGHGAAVLPGAPD